MICNRWCKSLICCAVFCMPLVLISALYAACDFETPKAVYCPDHITSTNCTTDYGDGVPCDERTTDESRKNDWTCKSSGEQKTNCVLSDTKFVCWQEANCKVDDEGDCVADLDTLVKHNAYPYIEEDC